jgi:Xaa-Pro aminopeptidase
MMNYQLRLKELRGKLKEISADAVLIEKRENYRYMSGFTGTFAYLLISDDNALIITDSRYTEQAAQQASDYELVNYSSSNFIENILNEKKIKKLAIEGDTVSVSNYKKYQKVETVEEIIITSGLIENLRKIKDENEISLIKKAVQLADEGFEHILKYVKPGITEKDIQMELEYYMRKNGASGVSFDIIVAAGARSSMPHAIAGDIKIKSSDVVLMDFGCIFEGYCSDITRTVFVGKPDMEMRKIYDTVLKVQKAGIENASEGKYAADAHMTVSKMIDEAGYKGRFGHGLGHGVGLEIHELPRVSLFGSEVLKNNMVVTAEPGIYVPGLGGVRIEDVIVINDKTPEILTKANKEMIVL